VPASATRTKRLLDERRRQPGASDAVGKHDEGMAVLNLNDFPALDGRSERPKLLGRGRGLQEHHEKMAGIPRGLPSKRVGCDDLLPLRSGPKEELGLHIQL